MVVTTHFPSRARARLAAVLQTAGDLVSIDDAVAALGIDRVAAAKTLARWQRQGWLKRVGRGIYAPIPLDSLGTQQVLKDPWVLVPALFTPGYVGGWSAAEHWDFTEQLFRSIFVFTARPIRAREPTVQGVSFTLRTIQEDALFGTKTLWREHSRVPVSDKHRTIVDLLSDPSTGGGIRHVESCLWAYLGDREADLNTLIRYADRLGNGAVFKRLGFLVARKPGHEQLTEACQARLTQGNAKLDPALPCCRLVKAWRLWIPVHWAGEKSRD
jgi:predicted transcriptional regulator of viral defense system